MKTYNKSNIPLAKNPRKIMTPWERKLWYDYLRYYPVRFQRQKAFGDFIVDFYCAKARLVIELDGSGHYETQQKRADTARTQLLEKMNLSVLRICNTDIDKNFPGVCEHIDNVVQKALPQSASLTAPSTEGAKSRTATIYALGFFDGVHLGHQALLAQCVRLSQELNMRAGAITFLQHPQTLFTQSAPALINTDADRDRLMRRFGVDIIRKLPVTKEVMSTPWETFLLALLAEDAAGFVCGEDYRFGHKGEGNAQKLLSFCKERGLPCVIVPDQLIDGIRVSSTHIRGLLEQGQMAEAVRFLGHPHILSGTVVPGRGLGHTMGIPTANLVLPADLVQPKLGVYACKAAVDGAEYLAVTNIGSRPTVGGHHITVEPWLLDFDGDLYNKEITLSFHAFLRPEQKFGSLEELQAEIRKNAAQTRKILGN